MKKKIDNSIIVAIGEMSYRNARGIERIVNFYALPEESLETEKARYLPAGATFQWLHVKKKLQEKCDTCRGKGEVMYSCCSGDVIDDDIAMCPSCHEHLGYETCEDCNGIGWVDPDTELSNVVPGLQQMAENLMDANKEN